MSKTTNKWHHTNSMSMIIYHYCCMYHSLSINITECCTHGKCGLALVLLARPWKALNYYCMYKAQHSTSPRQWGRKVQTSSGASLETFLLACAVRPASLGSPIYVRVCRTVPLRTGTAAVHVLFFCFLPSRELFLVACFLWSRARFHENEIIWEHHHHHHRRRRRRRIVETPRSTSFFPRREVPPSTCIVAQRWLNDVAVLCVLPPNTVPIDTIRAFSFWAQYICQVCSGIHYITGKTIKVCVGSLYHEGTGWHLGSASSPGVIWYLCSAR